MWVWVERSIAVLMIAVLMIVVLTTGRSAIVLTVAQIPATCANGGAVVEAAVIVEGAWFG
jgi:hypothetical protein